MTAAVAGSGWLGEPAVGLLGELARLLAVPGVLQRPGSPQVQPRQVNAGLAGLGHSLAQLDRPLPVCRRLGVAEDMFGSCASRQAGGQFLVRSACGGPVRGRLRGQRAIAGAFEHRCGALVQRSPLAGQQAGGHRLGQQRMPRPVCPAVGAVGQQPGCGQFPQRLPHSICVQPGDPA